MWLLFHNVRRSTSAGVLPRFLAIDQQFVVFCILGQLELRRHKEKRLTKHAEDLRSIRLEKRLTQEEVAEKLRVSQSYYSAVERGKRPAELSAALHAVSRMRTRTDRTAGGNKKAGREK